MREYLYTVPTVNGACSVTTLGGGVPEQRYGLPSVRPIAQQPWGQRMATLLDPDGNLVRMIEDAGSG